MERVRDLYANRQSVDPNMMRMDKLPDSEDNPMIKVVANYDKKFVFWLGRMYKALTSKDLNVDELHDIVRALLSMQKAQKYSYLESLMYPEVGIPVGIPAEVPWPYARPHRHGSFEITTNASGNFVFIYRPQFLSTTGTVGNLYYNNTAPLNGTSIVASNWQSVDFNATIPSVFSKVRLVSSSLIVSPKNALLNRSGVMGGGIYLTNYVFRNVGVFTAVDEAPWTDFSNIDKLYYSQIVDAASDSLRLLYYPRDNSDYEFKTLTDTTFTYNDYNMIVYLSGGQPNTGYRLDAYSNWECEVHRDYQDLIPATMSEPGTPHDREYAIRTVSQSPVQKVSDTNKMKITIDSIKKEKTSDTPTTWWGDLKKTVGDNLPSGKEIYDFTAKYGPMAINAIKNLF